MADVEDNSPLGVMNRIRKGIRAKARRLARKIPRQNIQNLEDNEESYKELEANVRTFHRNLDLWEEELPHDGDPDEEEDKKHFVILLKKMKRGWEKRLINYLRIRNLIR